MPFLGLSSVFIFRSDSDISVQEKLNPVSHSFELRTLANYYSGNKNLFANEDPAFLSVDGDHWVDSVFNSLDHTQRLGQLFMLGVYSNKNKKYEDEIANQVCNYNVGGIMFLKGGPIRQANLTNRLQENATTPMMIAIDAEWGLAMRLDSTIRFPHQMTLGAIKDYTLIYKMGAEIARECKRMGINVNFAPVADVNNNPKNPVIGNRSFGEDKTEVTLRALLYMKALQENGVLATAKHFPGHGDADADSHLELPVIKQSLAELDSVELFPFKTMISSGLAGMMVAHLSIPALDTAAHTPTTLSKSVVTKLLREQMGFKGLIFTDALNMKGVTKYYEPGIVDVKALIAGNDILLDTQDLAKAIEEINKAIVKGELNQDDIDARVKKILKVKYWLGLNNYKPVETKNLLNDLNTPDAEILNRQLFRSSLTILKNNDNILPLNNLESLNIASVAIGDDPDSSFQQYLNYYAHVDLYKFRNRELKDILIDSLLIALRKYNMVIISAHSTSIRPEKNYGISDKTSIIIDSLSKHTTVILDVFGPAYCINKIPAADKAKAILLSYEDHDYLKQYSAELLFGGIGTDACIPVSPNSTFHRNCGVPSMAEGKLQYVIPEDIGIDSKSLSKIDTIVKNGIKNGAMPGCQVLAVKDGKVFFNKSYGYQTYSNKEPVTNNDLYDLASVTKVAATTMVLMKLYDDKKLDLNKKLSDYLPDLKNTNKSDIIIRDLLTHQAGLKSWIPFWMHTVVNGKLSDDIFHDTPSKYYALKVADSLYMRNDYAETMWQEIKDSPIKDAGKYLYSDFTMIISKRIIESITHRPLDSLVYEYFYNPLGLSTMCFNPLDRFPANRIVPTENDITFRHQLLRGYVHDPAAAMFGGVSGHAGLFSNSNDLAILFQMILQHGEYAGRKYLDSATVAEFTRQQYPNSPNRRGLGFDRVDNMNHTNGSVCKSVSSETYGHTGFTGTCFWVDPKYNFIYIFLSNRVNPIAENPKLVNMNIRTDIQQVFYDSFNK